MERKCFDVETIGAILDLPENDPKRRHVDTCPRCQAIAASYQSFLKAEAPAGSNPASAEKYLEDLLKRRVGAPVVPQTKGPPGSFSWIGAVFPHRFAWAVAAIVVIGIGFWSWRVWTPESPVLRSNWPPEGITEPTELYPVQSIGRGAYRLRWQSVSGADGYRVDFYDTDLNNIYQIGPTADTTVVVRRDEFPPSIPSDLLWRVVVFLDGEEIGASPPAALQLR